MLTDQWVDRRVSLPILLINNLLLQAPPTRNLGVSGSGVYDSFPHMPGSKQIHILSRILPSN